MEQFLSSFNNPALFIIQLFAYSVIQLFAYSVIQLFAYSVIQLFAYSVIKNVPRGTFYLPKCINKLFISAGDTPGIRDACPIV